MKKLLSLLATVVVTASSASAVVACGTLNTQNNTSVDDNQPYNSGSDDEIINGGKGIDKGGDANLTPDQTRNKRQVKFNAQLNDVEKTLVDKVKQQAPLDLWGFNGQTKYPVLDYLAHLTKKDKDGNVTPLLDDKTRSTIEEVLGYADGVSAPSPTALGSMVASVKDLLPTLVPTLLGKIGGADGVAKIEKAVSGILTPQIKGYVDAFVNNGTTLDKYNNLTLNQAMESAIVGVAYVLGVLTNDRADVQVFKDLTNPGKIIKTKNADGKDITKVQIDDAIDYISTTLMEVFFGQKNISLIASGTSFDDTTDKPKVVLNNDDIAVISDSIQLVSLYIGQFDQFRFNDNDSVSENITFNVSSNSELKTNYDVITYVRSKKIGDIRKADADAVKFNPLRLISDISYYLGELDKPNGIYRVQALLGILFLDMDRSKTTDILLNWDDSDAAKKNVHGWSDDRGAEAKEADKAPLSRVIEHVMAAIMKNKIPDVFKDTSFGTLGWLIGALGFSWDKISTWAVHNTYMIIQSLVWNRGFELSTIGDFAIPPFGHPGDDGYGMSALNAEHDIKIAGIEVFDYPGLSALSQWNGIQKDGLLKLIFNSSNANAYAFLNNIASNNGWVKMFDKIKSMSNGKADVLSIIKNKVLPQVVPFSDEDGGYNTSSAQVTLKDSISNYKQVEFDNGGKKTIINTALNDTEERHIDINAWENSPSNSDKHPTFNNIIADKTDSDGNTTLYVNVTNIYNATIQDHNYYSRDTGKRVTTIHGVKYDNNTSGANEFLKSLSIERKDGTPVEILDKKVISSTHGTQIDASYAVKIKGSAEKNMFVKGWTFWNEGWSGFKYHGDEVWIGDAIVNMPWAEADDLNLYDTLKFDPKNPTFDTRTLDFSNGGLDKFKHLKVKGLTDDNEYIDLLENTRVSGLKVNVKTVASHAVEWMLNVLGIDNNPMHLPFMDDNTMGSLILEIGKQIDKTDPNDDSEAQKDNVKLNKYLDSFGIDINRYRYLVNIIFGSDGQDNIVTRLFNVLTEDKSKMATDLNKLLGVEQNNAYDKTGLIGALMYAFTPGLVGSDDDSPLIYGNTQKASPLWDKLLGDTGIIKSAWNWLNEYDINKLTTFNQVNADANYDSVFTKKDGDWNLTNAKGVITYKYTWEVRVKNADGSFTYKWRTLTVHYNVSAKRIDLKKKDSNGNELYKWEYTIKDKKTVTDKDGNKKDVEVTPTPEISDVD